MLDIKYHTITVLLQSNRLDYLTSLFTSNCISPMLIMYAIHFQYLISCKYS